jgi:hypothetical protein
MLDLDMMMVIRSKNLRKVKQKASNHREKKGGLLSTASLTQMQKRH